MGERLRAARPALRAEPAVNQSIFRINRDTRFSRDKTPYKDHLGIWMWEGAGKRMECTGFYFHIEAARFRMGAGMYTFPRSLLDTYRRAVVDPKTGPLLTRAMTAVRKAGPYAIGGSHYKRVPSGFDAEHKNAALLLHNGLWVSMDSEPPAELFTPDCTDFCFTHYRNMMPVHRWLLALTENA